MWEAARDRVDALGARVFMQHVATRIEITWGLAHAVVCNSHAGRVRIEANHDISTTDIRAAVVPSRVQRLDSRRFGGFRVPVRDWICVGRLTETLYNVFARDE